MGFFDNLSKAIGKALGGNKPKKKRGGGGRGNRESSGYARPNKPVKSTPKPQKIKTTLEYKPKPDTRFKPKSVSIERGEGITHQIQKIAKTSGIDLDAKQSYDLYKRLDKRIGSDNILSKTGKDTYKISSGKYKGDTGLRRTGKTGLTKDATKTTVNYLERIGKIEKLVKEPKPIVTTKPATKKNPLEKEVEKLKKERSKKNDKRNWWEKVVDGANAVFKDQGLDLAGDVGKHIDEKAKQQSQAVFQSKRQQEPTEKDKKQRSQALKQLKVAKDTGLIDEETFGLGVRQTLLTQKANDDEVLNDIIRKATERKIIQRVQTGEIDQSQAEQLMRGATQPIAPEEVPDYLELTLGKPLSDETKNFTKALVAETLKLPSIVPRIAQMQQGMLGNEDREQLADDIADNIEAGALNIPGLEYDPESFGSQLGSGASSLLTALTLSAATGTPIPAMALFGAQTAGSTYDIAREAGADPLQAGAGAIFAGAAEAALERVGIKGVFTPKGSTALTRLLYRSAVEGGQEFAQETTSNIGLLAGGGKGEITLAKIFENAPEAALMGVLLGGAVSGPVDVTQGQRVQKSLVEQGFSKETASKIAKDWQARTLDEALDPNKALKAAIVENVKGRQNVAAPIQEFAATQETANDFARNLSEDKLNELYNGQPPVGLQRAIQTLKLVSKEQPSKANSERYQEARAVIDRLYEKARPARVNVDDQAIQQNLEQGVGSNRSDELRQIEQNQANLTDEERLKLAGGDVGQAGLEMDKAKKQEVLEDFQQKAKTSSTQQVYEQAYKEDASGTDEEIKAHQYVSQNFDKVMSDYKSRVSKEYKTSTKDNIVSADDAKQVIPGFNAEMSGHYHEPSSSIGKAHYAELLTDKTTKDQPVLLMAGGSGAGKTVSLSKRKDGGPPVNLDDYAAVIDTNLSSFSSSEQKIEQAKESGRKVQIDYVYRPAELAFQGMMSRGERINRVVPIDAFVDTHIKSLSTIKELAKRYENDPDVEINVWDNSGGKGEQKFVSLDFLTDKSYNRDELERKLLQDAETAYKSGEITETTYKGIIQRVGETEVSGETGKSQVPDKRQVARPSNKTLAKQIIQNDGITIDLAGNQEAPSSQPKVTKPKSDKQASRVFDRLKEEHDVLDGDVNYNIKDMKKDAEEAVKLLAEDKNKAFRVAMGAETKEGVTNTAVNIAMAEKALDEGNISLYAQLVKNRSLAQTRRGQELVAEKGSVSNNSTARYVKELLSTKLDKLGKTYLGDIKQQFGNSKKKKATGIIDREVRRVKKRMNSKQIDLKEAQKIIDSLAC